jgi:aspartyl-tRNA(Asn)/glutamyl-tRNA(Gln) amidotransferase subunit C
MKIDKRLISHVAMVARLKLSDDELAKFTPQLSETLSFFEDIANAETEGIGISMQPVPMADSLREDRPIP